jgi:2-methylisocitrate lyase-like PEP mutase family enzyme
MKAAVAAARTQPHDFVLVGRAEGLLRREQHLDEVIRRLRAFAELGAWFKADSPLG